MRAKEEPLAFLGVGGEIAERIASKEDWDPRLGAPRDWPDSLKTALGIALASRFPHLIWWGPDLSVLYNDAYIPIFGPKHPHVLGRTGREAWGEVWGVIGPMLEQVMRGGPATWSEDQPLDLERLGFPEETYFTWSYSAIRDERGQVGGVWTSVVETTERVIGERRRETVRRLAGQVASARDVDAACAQAALVCASNPHDLPFVRLFVAEEDGARLAGAAGGVPAMDAPAAWPLARTIERSDPEIVDDVRERFGDVASAPWPEPVRRAVVVPLRKPGAGPAHGALVAGLSARQPFREEDLSFFELVAQQIASAIDTAIAYEIERRRAEELAALDRAKTAFFSNVSHELRTPLTLLLAPLEDAIDDPAIGETERAPLRVAHRNALRLLKLVNALLDFARIEAGRMQVSYEPVDLALLTREIASSFEVPMGRAGLRYVVRCEDDVGTVHVDRDMWEKIVLNLVSNAFKFTLEGEVEVALSSAPAGRVRLSVRDTGVGIPDAELPRLFERFHRVAGTHGRTHEGTGIGLSLAKELVELHGGTIGVESRVGEGTRFTIELPTGTAHLDPARIAAPSEGARAASARGVAYVEEALRWLPDAEEQSPAGGAAHPLALSLDARVLVADDNADMRGYVARLLGEHWKVDTVTDGEAALASIRASAPDLLVTDVMMPRLDGFQLLAALRAAPETRELPVLMLSARAGEEARVEGLEAGADDYLVKPFSARELVARVHALLAAATARAAERRHREFLEALVTRAPVGIAVWRGPEHVFQIANDAYLRMFGKRDVIGKRARDVFPESTDETGWEIFDRTYRDGELQHSSEYESRIDRRGDGTLERAWFSFTLAPLREEGAVAGLIAVIADVTPQVEARMRIEALREQAETASRAKDEFLSVLSHELRTPLNAIIGWSSMLRSGTVRAEQIGSALETVERNARVQARLIEDMLDLARIEQGKMVLSVGPVEMVRVVEAALESVTPAADAKGVRLQPVLDSHATIIGDADRLQQIVWNLLSNAIKFTPRGGRVQVMLRRAPSFVELVVADTGQGIDPAFLPHVFDRFRQADASSTRQFGGLGLGLAIVRSLVELHGGSVRAESEGAGRGAVFSVRLPMAPLRAERAPAAAAVAGTPAPDAPTFEASPVLAGQRVLVVDDERETRELLRFVLEQCDALVTTADGTDEALEQLARAAFDVVVSDVGMPGRDGLDLIRAVRALPDAERARVPAVALTAYARSEDRRNALRAGFDVHLAKPIDPGEFVAVLAALIERSRR